MSGYTLKTSDVAKLMRTSSDAIRFYEKKNIIIPERVVNNNYRQFTLDDIRRLYDCKSLQNLQFSISEIVEIVQNSSEKKFDKLLDEKQKEIEKNIELQYITLKKIKELKEAKDKISKYKNNFFIQESPDLIMYSYAKNNELDYSTINHPSYQTIIDCHAMFECTVIIPKENINEQIIKDKSIFGFSIDLNRAKDMGISNKFPAQEILSKRCVYTIVEATPIINKESLKPLLNWLKKHEFKLDGNIIGRIIRKNFEKGIPHFFYELWCPINS